VFEVRLEGVRNKNAFSDAVDFEISKAQNVDSYFEGSGNDAVDLMTSEVVITGTVFKHNGDKGISVGENSRLFGANNRLSENKIGIQSKDRSSVVLFNHSFVNNKTALHAYKKNWQYGGGGKIFIAKSAIVGENSQLCAVNNRLIGNMIGVESKDRSTAVLFNHSFVDNKTALHAYKKNWRYGEGGRIFIAKSAIVGGEVVAQAQKRSSIVLFDSYVDTQVKGKRISTVSVDDLSSQSASRSTLIPKVDERGGGLTTQIIDRNCADPFALDLSIHIGIEQHDRRTFLRLGYNLTPDDC
jgi:hypothetical protein